MPVSVFDPTVLEKLAAVLAGLAAVLAAWKGGGAIERARSTKRAATHVEQITREVLLDEGENGDATLRKIMRSGFQEMGERLGSLERGQRALQGDVRELWKAAEREARDLKKHEESEERELAVLTGTVAALALRFEETLPDPPEGQSERRQGRQTRRPFRSDGA